jgi:hypothetical protein
MKNTRTTSYIFVSLILALLLAACAQAAGGNGENPAPPPSEEETETETETGDGVINYVFTGGGDIDNTRYYNLSTGQRVSSTLANTTGWDIAIRTNIFCYVMTNSGVTADAAGSEGQGAVWFADTTDFDAVTSSADAVTGLSGDLAEYAPYVTDVTRYELGMNGVESGPKNIMTYYGYLSGDGESAATCFRWSDPGPPNAPFFEFNKKAFAQVAGGMPPPWSATGQVYIIRHGDGSGYSKVQFTKVTYIKGFKFDISIRFEELKE